jgi:hypothetical protein
MIDFWPGGKFPSSPRDVRERAQKFVRSGKRAISPKRQHNLLEPLGSRHERFQA